MSCFNNTALPGCYNDGTNPAQSVVIHYTYDNKGAPAVVITDLAGDVVAGADTTNTAVGACAAPTPDFEHQVLCDLLADGSSVQFVRSTISQVAVDGTPSIVVADFEMDYETPYTVQGEVGECPNCPELPARGLQTGW